MDCGSHRKKRRVAWPPFHDLGKHGLSVRLVSTWLPKWVDSDQYLVYNATQRPQVDPRIVSTDGESCRRSGNARERWEDKTTSREAVSGDPKSYDVNERSVSPEHMCEKAGSTGVNIGTLVNGYYSR